MLSSSSSWLTENSPSTQGADDHQPVAVGQRLEKIGDLPGPSFHVGARSRRVRSFILIAGNLARHSE
jgi:hypothetical protein